MATKVKGSAIQDKSIAIDALNQDLQDRISLIGVSDWDAKENEIGHVKNRTHYVEKVTGEHFEVADDIHEIRYTIENEYPYNQNYYLKIYYAFDNIEVINVFRNINEFVDEAGFVRFDDQYIGSVEESPIGAFRISFWDVNGLPTLVVQPSDEFFNSYYAIEQIVVEKVYYLEDKFLPDTIARKSYVDEKVANIKTPTPDWNAKEGEAGYIENRPIIKNFIKEQSMEFNEVDEWTSVDEGYDAVPSNTTVARVFADIVTDRGEHITTTVIVKKGESVYILEDKTGWSDYLQISMFDTQDGCTMNIGASFGMSGTLKCYYYEDFKQLDEDYIPNTIARKSDIPTISTPNWNASEGESGYIENKPFGIDKIYYTITSNGNGDTIDGKTGVIAFYNYVFERFPGEKTPNTVSFNFIPDTTDEFPTQLDFYIPYDKFYFSEVGDKFDITDDIYILTEHDDYYSKRWTIYFWCGNDTHELKIDFCDITYIDDRYLPDTVIKTTPQTLSDAKKNQARANLGILDFPYGFSKENNPDLRWIRIEVDDTDSTEGIIERGKYGYAYIDVTFEDGKRRLYSNAFDPRGDVLLRDIELSINLHNVWVDTNNGQTCTGVVYIFYSSTPIDCSFIKKLDTICLPEFVTLSNGLSENDKNQVKENLGLNIASQSEIDALFENGSGNDSGSSF